MKQLSVTQVAELKGVSRQRVLQLIEQGRLRAQKVGEQWVILERDAMLWTPLKERR